jgi:hypothetical protein
MVRTLETFARVGHSAGLNSASRWTPAAALPLYARLPAASPRHRARVEIAGPLPDDRTRDCHHLGIEIALDAAELRYPELHLQRAT